MAGRRLRDSVKSIVVENGVVNATITIAGLSNSYVHYVTTFEEYQAQRYEGNAKYEIAFPYLTLISKF